MSSSDRSMTDIQRAIRDAVRLHWRLFLAQGLITTVLGVLAIAWPQISSVAVDVYVGSVFVLAGLAGLGLMLLAPTASVVLWSLLTSALSLFVGVLLLWHPVEGAVSLTLVLLAFFIVEGVFQIIASFAHRELFPESWGWTLASGVADLILAVLIIAGWPGTASWALGLIVGVNLITSGVAITMLALTVRQVATLVGKAMG